MLNTSNQTRQVSATTLKENQQDTGGTNKHRTQGNTRADKVRLGHGLGLTVVILIGLCVHGL